MLLIMLKDVAKPFQRKKVGSSREEGVDLCQQRRKSSEREENICNICGFRKNI